MRYVDRLPLPFLSSEGSRKLNRHRYMHVRFEGLQLQQSSAV